jgi:hypothetical protein
VPPTNSASDEAKLKKIQHYIDRYLQHKNSFEKNDERMRKYFKIFNEKSKEPISQLHYSLGNCMEFYIYALKYVTKSRMFIYNTYPLAFNIKNKAALDLFSES